MCIKNLIIEQIFPHVFIGDQGGQVRKITLSGHCERQSFCAKIHLFKNMNHLPTFNLAYIINRINLYFRTLFSKSSFLKEIILPMGLSLRYVTSRTISTSLGNVMGPEYFGWYWFGMALSSV